MKKIIRIIVCVFLILACVGVIIVPDTVTIHAYTSKELPTYTMPWETDQGKMHIRVKDFRGSFASVELPIEGYQVKNLRTSSNKGIKAKVVKKGVTYKLERDDNNKVISKMFHCAYNWIELYATQKGDYRISFDVVDKNGSVIESKSLKVYANNEEAIKSIRVNGMKLDGYESLVTERKDVTMQVEMGKGYRLTKMTLEEMGTMSSKQTIKNGKKFRVEKTYYCITVYFKDKYTGRVENVPFYLKRWEG